MKKERFRSVAIRFQVWSELQKYCHKHEITLAEFVTAAIQLAIDRGLRIERNVIVNQEETR